MSYGTVCSFEGYTAKFSLLYPDALDILPRSNLKELFRLMCVYENDDAIAITKQALQELQATKKAYWGTASKTFSDGYRDPKEPGLDMKEKADRDKRNKSLYREVTRTKKAYDRAVKLEEVFKTQFDRYYYYEGLDYDNFENFMEGRY